MSLVQDVSLLCNSSFLCVNIIKLFLRKSTFRNWKHFLSGHFSASFFFIFVFSKQLIVNVQYKFSQWLNSNQGPLESEATALPTDPQPPPKLKTFCSDELPRATVLPKNSIFSIFVQVQNCLSVFKRLSFKAQCEKSKFPPKMFYNINHWRNISTDAPFLPSSTGSKITEF